MIMTATSTNKVKLRIKINIEILPGGGKENDEKTTTGLISKTATLHVQHTIFCRSINV